MLRVLVGAVALRTVSAAISVANLTVEYATQPLALPNLLPRFAWQTAGDAQSFYSVVVSPLSGGLPVWESGVVASAAHTQISYAGALPLLDDSDYNFTVTVTGAGGSVASGSTTFGTGLTSSSAWSASAAWVGAPDNQQMRYTFALGPEPITRARLYVTALGCHVTYVNGVRVSAPLAPGMSTVYPVRLLYDALDVVHLLIPGGDNVVAARIGQCKYGYLNEYCNSTLQQCTGLLAQLSLSQGSNVSVVTSNPQWLAAPSPITFNHLYHGETFDARLEQPGWNAPGFTPNAQWSPVQQFSPSLTALTATTMPTIGTSRNYSATRIWQPPTGGWVFDFGVNMAGYCTLDLSSLPSPLSPGTPVTLLHAEILTGPAPNGTAHNIYMAPGTCNPDTGGCANQTDTYYAAGVAGEVYTPHFHYAGFRYVLLTGWPTGAPAPGPAVVTAHFVHSALQQTGSVSFGPQYQILNQLQGAVLQTQQSNVHSTPTDCPQREKRGWAQDMHTSCTEASLNFYTPGFYENIVRSMVDAQLLGCMPVDWVTGSSPFSAADSIVTTAAGDAAPVRPWNYGCSNLSGIGGPDSTQGWGAVPDVIPWEKSPYGNYPGDPTWEVVLEVVSQLLLEQEGDLPFVSSLLQPSLLLHLDFFHNNTLLHGGLLGWSTYGDWNPPTRGLIDSHFVVNVHLFIAYLHVAEVAAAAGDTPTATALLAAASLLSNAMAEKWYNASSNAWGSTGADTYQILGLQWQLGGGVLTPSQQQGVADRLVSNVLSQGNHSTSGSVGVRYLYDMLCAVGRCDIALAAAASTSEPSLGYMLTLNGNGTAIDTPGTLWEGFGGDSYVSEGSKNHIFLGAGLAVWLYEHAAGIQFAHRVAASAETDKAEAVVACEAALSLPFSLSHRYGFSPRDITALCDTVTEVQAAIAASEEQWVPLSTYRAIAAAHATTSTKLEQPQQQLQQLQLEPRAAVVLNAQLVKALGSATAQRSTPHGVLSVSWQWDEEEQALALQVASPAHAAATRVAIPLALFPPTAAVAVADVATGETVCKVTRSAGNTAGAGASVVLGSSTSWRAGSAWADTAAAATTWVSGRNTVPRASTAEEDTAVLVLDLSAVGLESAQLRVQAA